MPVASHSSASAPLHCSPRFCLLLFLPPAIQLGSFVAEQLTGRHQVVYIRDDFVSLRESAVFTAK